MRNKKISLYVLVTLCFFATYSLYAQNAGIGFNIAPWSYGYKYDASGTTGETKFLLTLLGFSAFIDLVYFQFDAGYFFFSGTSKGEVYSNGSLTSSNDFPNAKFSTLIFRAIGKYPFDLDYGKLWPFAGVIYNLVLESDINGDGISDNVNFINFAPNDFFITVGVGLNYMISEGILIIPIVSYTINVTGQFTVNPTIPGAIFSYPTSNFLFSLSVAFTL